jgi:hypothetical protein
MTAEAYLKSIPPKWQYALDWKNVATSKLSYAPPELQDEIWADIKANPEQGRAFFGPSGWSKTTYAVAILGYIVRKHPNLLDMHFVDYVINPMGTIIRGSAIVRTPAVSLMEAHRKWENREGPAPEITMNSIEALGLRGIRTYLFLEELDKMRSSEFKQEVIWNLLDRLRDWNGLLPQSAW